MAALAFFAFFGFPALAALAACFAAVGPAPAAEGLDVPVFASAAVAFAATTRAPDAEAEPAVPRFEAVFVPFASAAGLDAPTVAGIAVDMALAASDSDCTAVSIALVALLMARSALVIVFAESVACPAAVFSFAAAFVTRVAADETARGIAAAVAAAAVRRALVRLALARLRTGFAAAVSVVTDPPPVTISYGDLIPRDPMFYTWR